MAPRWDSHYNNLIRFAGHTHEREWLLHIWDWEFEMAKLILNFLDSEGEWQIQFLTFGIGSGIEEKKFSKPNMGKIAKRVSGKSWEQEFPLMAAPLVLQLLSFP